MRGQHTIFAIFGWQVISYMGKILGIDYGTVRIGLAISDSSHKIAFNHGKISVKNVQDTLEQIDKVILEHDIELIVLGLPIGLNSQETTKSIEIRRFAKLLNSKICIDIKLWDERYSSKSAEQLLIEGNVRRKKRKEKIDSVAAQIILQNYLDFSENKANV